MPDRRRQPSSSPSIHPHYADLVRCVEHLLRSMSNLHERLHHSVMQYTMPSPSTFVSHGEYVYPAILVSLPMVVRAAVLALRDLRRFQFARAGAVLACVCAGTSGVALTTALVGGAGNDGSGMLIRAAYLASYLLVILVARRRDGETPAASEGGKQSTSRLRFDEVERRKSLRFVACLSGIYLHAPLLLANYSLGFPSAAFWSPFLATLVLPSSVGAFAAKNRALASLLMGAGCAFLLATSPPTLLVPRIFDRYTAYVLGVYTPLHFLLAAVWLA